MAGGLSTAPGGGTTASPAEPEGAQAAAKEPGGATLTGSVSPEGTAAQPADDGRQTAVRMSGSAGASE